MSATATVAHPETNDHAAGPKRRPKIGDLVIVGRFQPGPGTVPLPAQVIYHSPLDPTAVHVNIHGLGCPPDMMHNCPYSPTLKMGCWSWPDDVRETLTREFAFGKK